MERIKSSERQALIAEGKQAFDEGRDNDTCPYIEWQENGRWWLHGWWKEFYKQQSADAKKIANWLSENTSIIVESQAQAIGEFITQRGSYDRTKPILDNRICGVEFDIPAPESL